MYANHIRTLDDLKGPGASASGSTHLTGIVGVGGAATLPSEATSSNKKAIYEGGVTFGTRGREAGITATYGKELKRSSFIRRTVDNIKDISNKAKNYINKKFGDN